MSTSRPNTLAGWLRRHSLTLVAALGGAVGVAYAVTWHSPPAKAAASAQVQTTQTAQNPGEPERDTVQDVVQIALVLDTSSSMDGLINQARSHLWNMVDQMGKMTRVVNGKTRGVRIELALYEYGNDTLSAEQGYIRQVLPLTADLDSVSEKLHALFTNGGSEYAGQAITKVSSTLQWSSDPDAMRFIFVAGNESFNQGPVSAAEAMKAASDKDIHVQLIHCGQKDESWAAAAAIAKSDLMTIDQNHVAQHIPAPQDDQILQLGQQLNDTYIAYGAAGTSSSARQKAADASSAKMSKKVALERMQLKAKKAYKNHNWDLVDAVDNDGKFLEKATDADLPVELRGKTLEEKKAFVAAQTTKRAELKAKIAKLEADRQKYVEAEQAKLGGDKAQTLDTELMKSTRKTAAKKGYK